MTQPSTRITTKISILLGSKPLLAGVLLSLGAWTAELCSFPFLPYQRHGFGRIPPMGSGIGAEKRHEVGFPTDGRI
jgi:hypothetical protein